MIFICSMIVARLCSNLLYNKFIPFNPKPATLSACPRHTFFPCITTSLDMSFGMMYNIKHCTLHFRAQCFYVQTNNPKSLIRQVLFYYHSFVNISFSLGCSSELTKKISLLPFSRLLHYFYPIAIIILSTFKRDR